MSELINKLAHLLSPQPASFAKRKNYTLERTIGHGTFGVVRLGRKQDSGEEVAVKVILKSSLKGNENFIYRELDAIQNFSHPNIVPYLDWFESKDKFYMVFKLCTGGELFERLYQQGRFTEQICKDLIVQVLNAVDYLHLNGLVHRDLKPENLLFETGAEDSKLLLTDFGISKIVKEEEEELTTVCGSYGYVAPEVLLRKPYGKPVDMWSIGILTYLLLSGSNPFRKYDATKELIPSMLSEKYDFNSRYWKSISPEAKSFVEGLLKGDPDQRMSSSEALQHPWVIGQSATDHDLSENIRENFNARATYRRAFEKLKAVNILRHLANSNESLDKVVAQPKQNIA